MPSIDGTMRSAIMALARLAPRVAFLEAAAEVLPRRHVAAAIRQNSALRAFAV